MADYRSLPSNVAPGLSGVKPFEARASEGKLEELLKSLEHSPIAPATFENTNAAGKYGIQRDWLMRAKHEWLTNFDWRKHEDRLNSFPNYTASVEYAPGESLDMHFLALFSRKPDAIPLAFIHGWPGSVFEFLDILDLLKVKYTPETLPYHVIVPSLPGYGYSSGPPLDRDFDVEMAAEAVNNLMVGLGFGGGYIAQGGDLGSFVSRILALKYDACKGIHLNMMAIPDLSGKTDPFTDEERALLNKAEETIDTGMAFLLMQGTRAATIGLALSSSPLALLAWIGEKFLAYSDEDPPLDRILESVTFYWLTDTYPRCLYHNRGMGRSEEKPNIARISALTGAKQLLLPYVEKPCGYSLFPHEVLPVPKHWAALSCNLISFSRHESGGHFAALEAPEELLTDVEAYVEQLQLTK